jgi:hypothetical protein
LIAWKQLVKVASFEPWRDADGIERWLPFLGQRLELLKPLPLGDRGLLAGWLPRQREAVQLIELDALLAAKRLSDVVLGSGACWRMPQGRDLWRLVSAGEQQNQLLFGGLE